MRENLEIVYLLYLINNTLQHLERFGEIRCGYEMKIILTMDQVVREPCRYEKKRVVLIPLFGYVA